MTFEQTIEARIEARTAMRREYHALRRVRSARARGIPMTDLALFPAVVNSEFERAARPVLAALRRFMRDVNQGQAS